MDLTRQYYQVTSSGLKVRKGAGTAYAQIGTVKKGDYLKNLGTCCGDEWMHVYYTQTDKGYVSVKYIKPVTDAKSFADASRYFSGATSSSRTDVPHTYKSGY